MTTEAQNVTFTSAGNVVVTDKNDSVLWESGTRCDDDCYLAIDRSGILAIFGAISHRVVHSFFTSGESSGGS